MVKVGLMLEKIRSKQAYSVSDIGKKLKGNTIEVSLKSII